jgi:hypothetical protein
MATTPPEQQPPTTAGPATGPGARPGMAWGPGAGIPARLPIPGNAEFAVYVIALIVIAIIAWIADSIGPPQWLEFTKWATGAYLLSRGIAKASRVLEQ